MAFYYSDGDGGRRELETGGGTTYKTQTGAVIARDIIQNANILAQVTNIADELGDLWTIGFTNTVNNIYAGDLLLYNGSQWQLLKTSPNRPDYLLPTASASTKGGVKIGSTMKIDGGVLDYELPIASSVQRGDFFH